jgi:hypothetical protein
LRAATGTHLTVKLRPSAATAPGVAPAGDAALPFLIRTFDLSIVGLGSSVGTFSFDGTSRTR